MDFIVQIKIRTNYNFKNQSFKIIITVTKLLFLY